MPYSTGCIGETEVMGDLKTQQIVRAGIVTFINLTEKCEVRGKEYSYQKFQSIAETCAREVSINLWQESQPSSKY